MSDKTTVGIDVSKYALDVYIDTSGRMMRLENSASGIMQLLQELEDLHISGVIMEATSRYHSLAESMLISAGLPVAVINPRQIKNFARAMGKVAITACIRKFITILNAMFRDQKDWVYS